MSSETGKPRFTASIWPPTNIVLICFPVVCFVGAFVTDIVYWRSTSFIWETFSVWLLTAGLVLAAVVVIAMLIDLVVGRRHLVDPRSNWTGALGGVIVIVLSVFNAFIHSRDGFTAVVPTGIVLSGIVVLVIVVTGVMSGETRDRQRIGVPD